MRNLAANPLLVRSTRGGVTDTLHRGSFCLANADGDILASTGDMQRAIFTRSSLKLIQVLPLLAAGGRTHYDLNDAEITLMCASHNAEPEHVAVAAGILEKCGLEASDLACGGHPPMSAPAYANLLRSGVTLTDLHNNCSGKHAGFLAMCLLSGWPTKGYLAPDHTLQVRIREFVALFSGLRESDLVRGTDGCSAPNYAMALPAMARMFAQLANPVNLPGWIAEACGTMRSALRNAPFMLGGTGRFCTDLLMVSSGEVFGKLGADGVYCLGIPGKGLGLAVKIDDGLHGPQYVVVTAILRELGFEWAEKLAKWESQPLMNFKDKQTGERGKHPDLIELLRDLNLGDLVRSR